ncbi:hypothetical protein [Thiosulfatihalobacter marinus]|uniref:hypothetical protein n=1 Tax=Thiosulfatihalobacter marinus TaxID=2792481 RepID=UPI0018D5CD48|nr:hypothetical protein [Thiosulfatihalobacter marinus]
MGDVSDRTDAAQMGNEFDRRIRFLDDLQIMDVDFQDFRFDSSELVNRFYDRIEARIRDTGEDKWFFLINYSASRIEPEAWLAFSRRGKALNLAHSMGSVRYDAGEETRRQIERDAQTERFDPNLFSDRDSAIARIGQMTRTRRARVSHDPNYATADFVRRVSFDPDGPIMDVDFAHFTFYHSRDVDDFYDYIEDRIKDSDRKWFFVINYEDCKILPAAWVRYAYRGKRLNKAASLGTVRYAPGSETEAEIRLRAESQDFDPNIRNTRAEALERIAAMKAAILAGMGRT